MSSKFYVFELFVGDSEIWDLFSFQDEDAPDLNESCFLERAPGVKQEPGEGENVDRFLKFENSHVCRYGNPVRSVARSQRDPPQMTATVRNPSTFSPWCWCSGVQFVRRDFTWNTCCFLGSGAPDVVRLDLDHDPSARGRLCWLGHGLEGQ